MGTLLCSAQGRIRKIVLFDTKYYHIPDADTATQRLTAIRQNFINLIDGMHALNSGIEFFIFYNRAGSTDQKAFYDRSIKTRFIPVNRKNKSWYVPTRWAQDVLLAGPNDTLYYEPKSIAPLFADFLCKKIGLKKTKPFPTLTAGADGPELSGGDILIGKFENENYILHGIDELDVAGEKKLQAYFGVSDLHHIQKLSSPLTKAYKRPFYHLDQFCMLAGNMRDDVLVNQDRHIVLTTDLQVTPLKMNGGPVNKYELNPPVPSDVFTGNEIANSKNILFHNIKLPTILFQRDNSKTPNPQNIRFALSYQNCIVENYREQVQTGDTGDYRFFRKINVYFPDYRSTFLQFVTELFQENDANSNQKNIDFLLSDSEKEFDAGKHPINDLLKARYYANRYLNRIHLDIRAKLADVGIYNIQFVDHDFYNQAQSGGSLHCIAKVVERDNSIMTNLQTQV